MPTDITIIIHKRRPQSHARPKRGPIKPAQRGEYLPRRLRSGSMRVFDLGAMMSGDSYYTRPDSFGGIYTFSNPDWSDLTDFYNYPLTITAEEWKTTFRQIKDGHDNVAVNGAGSNGEYFYKELTTGGFALSQIGANPNGFGITDGIEPHDGNKLPFYNSLLYYGIGLRGVGGYWTTTTDPTDPSVITPDIDYTKAFDVYLAPKVVRVSGTYLSGVPHGLDIYYTDWTGPLPYPAIQVVFFSCDEAGAPAYYRLVYRTDGVDIEASDSLTLPTAPGRRRRICGLGNQNDDGGWESFDPDRYQFNSPTVVLDRAAVKGNYYEGNALDADEYKELDKRRVQAGRSQGGRNIKKISGVWSTDSDNDDLTFVAVTVGGKGTVIDPLLMGAVNQGGHWWYLWKKA